MIGVLIRSYEQGRRDAQAGDDRRAAYPRGQRELAYAQGYRDELQRMREAKRLPQCRLELTGAFVIAALEPVGDR